MGHQEPTCGPCMEMRFLKATSRNTCTASLPIRVFLVVMSCVPREKHRSIRMLNYSFFNAGWNEAERAVGFRHLQAFQKVDTKPCRGSVKSAAQKCTSSYFWNAAWYFNADGGMWKRVQLSWRFSWYHTEFDVLFINVGKGNGTRGESRVSILDAGFSAMEDL